MENQLEKIKKELLKAKDAKKALILAKFFKTGKGEYGEGDSFLGIVVPKLRMIAKKFTGLKPTELQKLLESPWHEFRLTAILILVEKYQKSPAMKKLPIVKFYLKNYRHINNWDLIDLSAPKILGEHLINHDRSILYKLAESKNLWQRRMAIVATLQLIRIGQFSDTLEICRLLIQDKQPLIHKATGWMLREVGKRDQKQTEKFLDQHYKKMPRTMLRYSIERFEENKRRHYLSK